MSTTMAKPETVERKWFVIDAAGKPLGRVAAKAASMLRGKHKVNFTPHVDCGDHIIIINCILRRFNFGEIVEWSSRELKMNYYVLRFLVSTEFQGEGSFLPDIMPQSILWCIVLYSWH